MKHLTILSLSVTLIVIGCTANDKTPAGLEGSLNAPRPSAASSDGRTQASAPADPSANGGPQLPARVSYHGSALPQNLDPAALQVAQPRGCDAKSSGNQRKPTTQQRGRREHEMR